MSTFPITDAAFQIESLYVGYFGRAGDPAGVMYWVEQLNPSHGGALTLAAIAESFSRQPEAQAAHPFLAEPQLATQAQIASFITTLYENLFERAPDAAGAAYWQQHLSANLGKPGAIGSFILSVISGAQAEDAATLSNKLEAAQFFFDQLAEDHLPFDEAAAAVASSTVDIVSSDPSTVTLAELIVQSLTDVVANATYTAPPNQLHLVLNPGEILYVQDQGLAYGTTNDGGAVRVDAGTIVGTTINSGAVSVPSGVAINTTINGGVLLCFTGGRSISATVNASGRLEVHQGLVLDTTINKNGLLLVADDTLALETTIASGVGFLQFEGGTANNITFGDPSAGLYISGSPTLLTGTIKNWQVGNVIQFADAAITAVGQTGNKLTLTFSNDQTASYLLAGQQAGTEFKFESGGRLFLVQQSIPNQLSSVALDEASVPLVGVSQVLDPIGMALVA